MGHRPAAWQAARSPHPGRGAPDVRTIAHPSRPSRCTGAPAVGAALIASAVLAAASSAVATDRGAGPRVADRGCVAGDAGGAIHCQDVLNNSLNGISVHILGH